MTHKLNLTASTRLSCNCHDAVTEQLLQPCMHAGPRSLSEAAGCPQLSTACTRNHPAEVTMVAHATHPQLQPVLLPATLSAASGCTGNICSLAWDAHLLPHLLLDRRIVALQCPPALLLAPLGNQHLQAIDDTPTSHQGCSIAVAECCSSCMLGWTHLLRAASISPAIGRSPYPIRTNATATIAGAKLHTCLSRVHPRVAHKQ
jgi:hypothetical protein